MKRSEWADTWLQQAKHDLEAARALRDSGFWDTCALMCQQAAEKAVKALWIDVKSAAPPRIHWVERLAEELSAPAEVIDLASILVADYTTSRYPDSAAGMPYGQYSREDADDRLDKAQTFLAWVEGHWEDQ